MCARVTFIAAASLISLAFALALGFNDHREATKDSRLGLTVPIPWTQLVVAERNHRSIFYCFLQTEASVGSQILTEPLT